MINSYFNLPFGGWANCQFPSVIAGGTPLGKIVNGSDVLIWIGRFQLVMGRSKRKQLETSAEPCGIEEVAASGCPPTERIYRMLRNCPTRRG